MADAAQRAREGADQLQPGPCPAPAEPLPLHGRSTLPDIRSARPLQASVRNPREYRPSAQPATLQVPAAAAAHEVLPELSPADTQERSHLSSLQGQVKVQEPKEAKKEGLRWSSLFLILIIYILLDYSVIE